MSINEENKDLYLVFSLNEEMYGTQLLQVREVIEKQEAKPVPNTIDSYLGVINVRGEIIGAIDLRIKFGYPIVEEVQKNSAMIVFNTSSGAIAVLTDKLEGVFQLNLVEKYQKPKIESKIPNDHIIGMYQFKDNIITVIDLFSIVDRQEIADANIHNNEIKESIWFLKNFISL